MNFNQFLSNHPTNSNFYDTRDPSKDMLASIPFYRSNRVSTDRGICDEMVNCRLTDSWMSQQINLPITQIAGDIPILNPFVPMRLPIELQTTSERTFHHHQNPFPNVEYLRNVYSVNQLKSVDVRDKVHPHQQLFQGGFSRFNYEPSANYRNDAISTSGREVTLDDRVHTSIKFQDRNRKLDFKVNFREENRKVDGCFHRDDVAPPKKKWIRHYMTGKSFFS